MSELEGFQKVAGYLTHPLVLVGFVLLLFFGIHKVLITSGILKVPEQEGGTIVKLFLQYGFIIALVTILAGFMLKGVQDYFVGGEAVKKEESKIALTETKKEISQDF